jgi:parallel beta-helix repeat protein
MLNHLVKATLRAALRQKVALACPATSHAGDPILAPAANPAGKNVRGQWWLVPILLALAVTVSPAAATGDLCGTTIVADLELDHDLNCSGPGLIVGADGIKLNLHGHTIAGSGDDVGISVVGRTDVSITGGEIRNFFAGVRVTDSSDVVIKGNVLNENTEGVDCQAGCTGSTIKENEFGANRSRGIMLRSGSGDNEVKENIFTGNRVGILLFGSLDSIVKENLVTGSLLANIRVNVGATGNLIKENSLSASLAGIEFLVAATGSATGNSVIENTVLANTCGLKGPLAGNPVEENVFIGNSSDICG